MTYVEPTSASFKARFPAFSAVSDSTIQAILVEAIPQVGETWLERDRAPAIQYLTAHLLTMEGYPASSSADAATNLQRGAVKRFKVGDVETEFSGSSSSAAGGGGGSGYGLTEYGRRYLEIMRHNFPAIAVV